MNTIRFATCTAYIDPITGEGLLVMARPEDDLTLGGVGLHEADWNHAIAELDRLGWEPTEEDGGVCYDGDTMDGRAVIGLGCREPITTMPTLTECAEATGKLARMAGMTV
jgi:hypothetical protein